jgi:hypothetical protein
MTISRWNQFWGRKSASCKTKSEGFESTRFPPRKDLKLNSTTAWSVPIIRSVSPTWKKTQPCFPSVPALSRFASKCRHTCFWAIILFFFFARPSQWYQKLKIIGFRYVCSQVYSLMARARNSSIYMSLGCFLLNRMDPPYLTLRYRSPRPPFVSLHILVLK